jgi:hypothetical protein
MKRTLSILILFAACEAHYGQQGAIGPTFGYVFGRGASVGWETGGGAVGGEVPVTYLSKPDFLWHFSAGMSWRRTTPGSPRTDRLTYLAWEPFFFEEPVQVQSPVPFGATLGFAHADSDGWRPMVGLWEMVPLAADIDCHPCATLSIAVGYRWAGRHELYVTPKIGIVNDFTFKVSD